ncbi:MAG: DUF3048 domain-containing protein [Anaerolineae bacterium]|nr:DUF3048 domain-containing protein [Anaerolineae bacterium]
MSLFWLSPVLLITPACGGAGPKPTPEVEVVVYSTEAPSTPTSPAATPMVGTGAMQGDSVSNDAMTGPPEFGLNRPPNENPLTGLTVDDQALIHRRPLMVRIGNDIEARPQVGLNEAEVVYEEMVEWWITRFTAIYLSRDLEMIAPIRSARLINLQLTPQYQGALAHSGGSDPVRWQLSQTNIVDLDEFYNRWLYFYRDEENWATRLAFDATQAREHLLAEGLESDVGLRGFVFMDKPAWADLPAEAIGEAQAVTVPYPPQTSEALWQYDAQSGRYLRFTTGEPMLDFNGSQITAANVVIYFAEHQETDIVEDSIGGTSINIIVNGFGTAWLLRDGKVLKGNWETDGAKMPLFIFNDGRPLPFKRGNTWIQVLPLGYPVDIDGQTHWRLGEAEAEATVEPETLPTAEPTATATPIGSLATATPN